MRRTARRGPGRSSAVEGEDLFRPAVAVPDVTPAEWEEEIASSQIVTYYDTVEG
jgi:hypothetical protein